jgi:2-keto-4-pentenoate hydratase
MTPQAEQSAAETLVAARRDGIALAELAPDMRPATMAEGYRIQNRVRTLWCDTAGDRVAGWKIGATAAPVQDKFGVKEPFAGPFFGKTVFASPAQMPAVRLHHRAIESEFAFRFGRAVTPQSAPFDRAALVSAVDAVVPAFEIVSPRFTDLLFGRAPTAVADCALNAAFVFGTPYTNWQQLDLPKHTVRLTVNGKPVAEGTGAAVLGDPMTVLVWAANHLSQQGITIEAGQIISTGTTTGIVHLAIGDVAVADFGTLGTIQLQLT